MTLRLDGRSRFNIWEHSATVARLYLARARDEAEEMTCAAQAAELLSPLIQANDSLLDAGCGTGHFFHSLRRRSIPAQYYGIDSTPSFVEVGRRELARFGLAPDRLVAAAIEDVSGSFDHVVCMNVLSNIDNYHRPLERLLLLSRKNLILRESIKDGGEYRYVRDRYLDPEVDLKVHVNSYDRGEILSFIEGYGFEAREIPDRRTEGRPELVIDHPHYWTFIVAHRRQE